MISVVKNKKYFFYSSKIPLENKLKIKKTENFNEKKFETSIPGSKSITNRALVLSALNSISVTLSGFLFAEDTYWGLVMLEILGFEIQCDFEKFNVTITPPQKKNIQKKDLELYLGKSGTLARFFPAVILNFQKTFPWSELFTSKFDGDPQLKKRPISEFIDAVEKLNGKIFSKSYPLEIQPSDLQGKCEISGKTSGQFLSGLLLAAYGSRNSIFIQRKDYLVQPDYIRITLKMIEEFGGKINYDSKLTEFSIDKQSQQYNKLPEYNIEADASTVCYFVTLAVIHNFNFVVNNLGYKTLQPDFEFISILKQIGADINIFEDKINVNKIEKSDNLVNKSNFLNSLFKGNNKETLRLNFSKMSDQALTIGILALILNFSLEIYGVEHIRFHECDRIQCFVQNCRELGFLVTENKDGFLIAHQEKGIEKMGSQKDALDKEKKGIWKTHHDHRFGMCGALLASVFHEIEIENPQCVEKTCPQFFEILNQLGFQHYGA